jgi:hypothetical protein
MRKKELQKEGKVENVKIYLTCVIFNDAFSSSGFVMLNAKVTNERSSGQNMDVSDHDIL